MTKSATCLLAQVRTLQPQGVQSWWQPGHPGWAIYPVDSDHFLSTGVLDSVSVNTESISAPPPSGSPGTSRTADLSCDRNTVPYLSGGP